jgi:CelD/BcsL family acetyltransferase involved in cellulose biosynthesis
MRLAPLSGLAAEDLTRWRELAAAAAEPNPFYEPDYALPLARALGEHEQIALAIVEDGRRWLACLPVRRMARWHRIPLPSLAGWRGRGLLPALLGTPLVEAERLTAATGVLLAGMAATPGVCFAVIDGLVADGPVHAAVRDALASQRLWSHVFSREDRAFQPRRAENDYLEHRMKRKHLRYLRRQGERLGEALGGELELVDRAGDERAVAELIELEGASRLASKGEVLSADPAMSAFFGEICAAFAAQGRLQLLSLRAGGRTAAVKCNLLADPGVFSLKIAYEESLGDFSPGIQMESAALTLFHTRPESAWIDSCAFPGNGTVNRLMSDRRALVTLTIARRAPRTLLAAPAIRAARRLRDRAIAGGARARRG